jgi:hypothetical protein
LVFGRGLFGDRTYFREKRKRVERERRFGKGRRGKTEVRRRKKEDQVGSQETGV